MPRTVYVPEAGRALAFPDGTTDQQILTYVKTRYAPTPPSAPPQEEVGAFGAGLANLLGQSELGVGRVAQAAGLDGLSKYLYDKAQENTEYAARHKPQVADVTEIDSAGDAASWLGDTLVQQLPNFGLSYGATLTGMGIGSVVPVVGTTIGGIIGLALSQLPAFIGGNMQEQMKESGVTPEQTSILPATGGAVAQTISESVVDKMIFRGLPVTGEIAKLARRAFLGEVFKIAAAEGVSEGAQQAIQIAQANPDRLFEFGPEVQNEIMNAAAAGVAAGGVLGGASTGIGNLRAPSAPKPVPQIDQDTRAGAARGQQTKRNGEINLGVQALSQKPFVGNLKITPVKSKVGTRYVLQDAQGSTIADFSDPVLATAAVDQYKKLAGKDIKVQSAVSQAEVPTTTETKISPAPTVEPVAAPAATVSPEATTEPVSSPEPLYNNAAQPEPPVPDGMVRVYHSGSEGDGVDGRWVSTNKQYASDYRRDLPLYYTDIPANDPRVTPDEFNPEQTVGAGFTYNFELKPEEAAQLVEIPREQPAAPEVQQPVPAAAVDTKQIESVTPEQLAETTAAAETFEQLPAQDEIAVDEAAQQEVRAKLEEQKQQIAGDLTNQLKQYGLKGVELQFIPAFTDALGRPTTQRGSEAVQDGKSIIKISMAVFDADMSVEDMVNRAVEILNHESIHSLSDLGLLRPVEMKMLFEAAAKTKVPGKNYTYLDYAKRVYEPLAKTNPVYANPEAIAEEGVAEMFRDWRKGKKNIPSGIRGIINRVFDIFRRMFGAMKKRNYQDVFKDITEGKVGRRNPDVKVNPNAKAVKAETLPSDYRLDNPGGKWLEEKLRYASEAAKRYPRGSYGKFLSGAVTAYAGHNGKLMLPVSELSKLKGANNETRVPGDPQYDELKKSVDKNGYTNETPVMVFVNHKGEAYLNEGNTRVAVAKDKGVDRISAWVHWFNGAEGVDGNWSPESVASMERTGKASADPENPEFKQWFGDGALVDEKGKPLKLYTGTSKDTIFESFKDSDRGTWVTTNPESASQYSVENDSMGYKRNGWNYEKTNTKSRVIPLYSNVKNILDLSTPEAQQAFLDKYNIKQQDGPNGYMKMQAAVGRAAMYEKYDAIKWAPDVWAIFNPKKTLKSQFNPFTAKSIASPKFSIEPEQLDVSDNGFFSATLRAVANSTQNKGTGQQWLGIIKNSPGVKPEEIEWLGLADFLNSKPSFTKAEVSDFINANDVKVEEVLIGDRTKIEELQKKVSLLFQLQDDWTVLGDEMPQEKFDEMQRLAAETRNVDEDAVETNHEVLVLPGGNYYRELLLTLPNHRGKEYSNSHFKGVKNYFAHVRFDERRTEDGKKVLFINEMQSDWHQAGRKKGYVPSQLYDGVKKFYDERLAEIDNKEQATLAKIKEIAPGEVDVVLSALRQFEKMRSDLALEAEVTLARLDGVGDAPFKNSWDELTIKRMVRFAANNGFEYVAWPSTLEQVSEIEQWSGIEKRGDKYFIPSDAHEGIDVTPIVNRYLIDVPRIANRLYKKFGTRTVQGVVGDKYKYTVNMLPLTPEMRDSVMKGQAKFDIDPDVPQNGLAPQYPYGHRVPQVTAAQTDEALGRVEYGAIVNGLDRVINSKTVRGLTFFVPEGMRPDKNTFTTFIQNFADRIMPLGQLVDYVRAHGGTVPDALDPYMQAQLSQSQVSNDLEWREDNLYKDVLVAMRDGGITASEMEDYLYALHAPERNAWIASINPGADPALGSGMSNEEAAAIIARVNADPRRAAFEAVEQRVRAIIDDTNRLRVEAGLTPDFDNLVDEEGNPVTTMPDFQKYVPLRGYADESAFEGDVPEEMRARIGRGFKIRGREDMRAFGRTSRASDIIAHAMLQNSEAVIRAAKNRVNLSLLGLIESNPVLAEQMGVSVMGQKPLIKYITSKGVVKTTVDPMYKNRDDVLLAKRDGKDVAMQIDNKFLQKALIGAKSGNPEFGNAVNNFLQRMNRFLAGVNTVYNPEFMLVNFPRDLQQAAINITQYDLPGIRRKIIKDALPAVRDVFKILRDPNAQNNWSQWYHDFREDGGNTSGFWGSLNIEDRIREIEKMTSDLGAEPHRAKKAFQWVKQFLEDGNGAFENAVRLSVYKNVREAGVSRDRAAMIAKNLTINFDQRGVYGPALNSLYLFYNASVQGTFALGTAMARSKKVRRMLGGLVVMGIVQDQLNAMMSGGDDEDKDYDKIPDYVLESNFLVMDPFGYTDKGYFKIPLPYGANAFYNLGRALSRNFRGKYTSGQTISTIGWTAVDAFNPIGGTESFINFMAPTAVDPIVSLYLNNDFSGKRIYPEAFPGSVPKANSQTYFSSTSPVFTSVAQFLNKATGGTEYVPGMIDLSPDVMEYVFDYFTGATGAFVRRLSDTATLTPEILSGDFENVEINSIPFARKWYGNVSDRVSFEDYFDKVNHVLARGEEWKSALKEGDPQRIKDVKARFGDEIAIYPAIRALANRRNQLASELRKVKENEKIPPEQKRRRIEAIRKQIDVITERVNKLYGQKIGNKYPGLFS